MYFSRTCFLFEVEEELLVEDEGHAADLFHLGLRRGVPVDEVGCDGDRQLPSKLLPLETCGSKKSKKHFQVKGYFISLRRKGVHSETWGLLMLHNNSTWWIVPDELRGPRKDAVLSSDDTSASSEEGEGCCKGGSCFFLTFSNRPDVILKM